jgi:small neutral amino acid transporter SnatA (MarC family)
MVPSIMNLRIEDSNKFRLRLWLPLFLVWPIVLVLFLILLPFLVVAEVVLRLTNVQIYLFRMLGGVFSLLSAMRGLTVRVKSVRSSSIVDVVIR